MRLKKAHFRFTMFLILCTSILSIQSVKAQDSIKYDINESKALVDSYLNLPRFVELYDSSEAQIVKYKSNAVADSIMLKSCEDLRLSEKGLIELQKQQSDELKSEVKKLNNRKKFWKITSGILSIPASITIYNLVRK